MILLILNLNNMNVIICIFSGFFAYNLGILIYRVLAKVIPSKEEVKRSFLKAIVGGAMFAAAGLIIWLYCCVFETNESWVSENPYCFLVLGLLTWLIMIADSQLGRHYWRQYTFSKFEEAKAYRFLGIAVYDGMVFGRAYWDENHCINAFFDSEDEEADESDYQNKWFEVKFQNKYVKQGSYNAAFNV